jgi:hypothetical protein
VLASEKSEAGCRLIRYYRGEAPDEKGRYLTELLEWSDEQLEIVHDYIQWMFPLKERGFNPNAPLLNQWSIAEFHAQPGLREMLRACFRRMLRFYGLQVCEGRNLIIEPGPNFDERAENWLSPGNHNHLRISRILKSLFILGLETEAKAFLKCLSKIRDEDKEKPRPAISEETFWFWRTAVDDRGL